ncbi:hypothetical protein, variant [Aphanomyces astaci]|nr:hypothetical protein, variant [Aphanomyces astaci]ETV76764.1 hypothetical protein, variant [Aphanomyces astaci]|eukprot:XP_009833675.1 hypothetical protein, variant [Aphanomyces astaci]
MKNTALVLAVQSNDVASVDAFLLRPSLNAVVVDMFGMTPLMWAIRERYTSIVTRLLSCAAVVDNINLKSKEENTALMIACRRGNVDAVNLVLALPTVDVHLQGRKGCTALGLAAMHGRTDIVHALLGYPDIALSMNAVSPGGSTPLFNACKNGHQDIAKLFLAHPSINLHADVDQSPLYIAASQGRTQIVELLLQRACYPVNQPSRNYAYTALHGAARGGYINVVKLLLDQPGIDINFLNDDGQTAFHEAAKEGHDGIIELFLQHPQLHSINLQDVNQCTALRLACHGGNSSVVMILLKRNDIDVNLPCSGGNSPLMAAVMVDDVDSVSSLVRHPHIQVNHRNYQQDTALLLGASSAINVLLEHLLSHPDIDKTVQNVGVNGENSYKIPRSDVTEDDAIALELMDTLLEAEDRMSHACDLMQVMVVVKGEGSDSTLTRLPGDS